VTRFTLSEFFTLGSLMPVAALIGALCAASAIALLVKEFREIGPILDRRRAIEHTA